MASQEVREKIVTRGVELVIVATEAGESEWEVYVENDVGVRSTWLELFDDADSALQAARTTIEQEGPAGFVGREEFSLHGHPTH